MDFKVSICPASKITCKGDSGISVSCSSYAFFQTIWFTLSNDLPYLNVIQGISLTYIMFNTTESEITVESYTMLPFFEHSHLK